MKKIKKLIVLLLAAIGVGSVGVLASAETATLPTRAVEKIPEYVLTEEYWVDEAYRNGFTPDDGILENQGLLLHTTANATFTLLEKGYGDFSMVALPISSEYGVADFSEMQLVFNGGENNVLAVEMSSAENANGAYILYDLTYNGVSVGSGTMKASFSTKYQTVGNCPIYIKFNPEEKYLVFDYDYSIAESEQEYVDLSGTLDSFSAYSAKIAIKGVSNGATASLLLMEVGGMATDGNFLPVFSTGLAWNGVVGKKYALSEWSAYDLLGQRDCSYLVTAQVYNDEIILPVAGNAFIADTAGEYTVVYSLSNSKGETYSYAEEVVVFEQTPGVRFVAEQTLLEEYLIYEQISVPVVKAESELLRKNGSTLPVSITAKCDGETVANFPVDTDMVYTFEKAGTYVFEYMSIDKFGGTASYSMTCNVKNDITFVDFDGLDTLYYGYGVQLPVPTAVYNGERVKAHVTLISPVGQEVPVTDGVCDLLSLGEYQITYSASVGGKTIEKTYIAECVYNPASIIKADNNIVEMTPNVEFPHYSVPGSGLKIIGKNSGAQFSYNGVIDLNAFSKDKEILSLQILGAEYAARFQYLYITLTDVYDKDNSVVIRYTYNDTGVPNSFRYSYVLTSTPSGHLMAVSNEASAAGTVLTDRYGTVVNVTFDGRQALSQALVKVYFDYAEKQLWVEYAGNGSKVMVLDYDDPTIVGENNIWNGFTTGEVTMSVSYDNLKGEGGVIVNSIAGQDLSGANVNAANVAKPTMSLSTDLQYANILPDGVKGMSYALPKATSISPAFGYLDVNLTLYKETNGEYQVAEETINGLSFVPTTAAKYKAVYSAVDNVGAEVVRTVEFSVYNTVAEIVCELSSDGTQPVVHQYYQVPTLSISGGSGIVSYEETFYLNGKQVVPNSEREIFLGEYGVVTVKVKAIDYLQRTYENEFVIQVQAGDPVVMVSDVPETVRVGTTLVLPAYQALDYSQYGQEGFNAQKKVTVNGVDVTETMSYSVTEAVGARLSVKYYAIGDGVETVEEFTVFVVQPQYTTDYFLFKNADGSLCTDAEIDATVEKKPEKMSAMFVVSEDKTIYLPNALVANDLIIKLNVDETANQFDHLQVRLTDAENSNIELMFKIQKDKTNRMKIYLNGDVSINAGISGLFTDSEKSFYIAYNNQNYGVYNEASAKYFTARRAYNTDVFNGFPSGRVKLSVSVVGVQAGGKGSVGFMQVSNQTFASSVDKDGVAKVYTDATGPAIGFDKVMLNESATYNEIYTVSSAFACDVLNGAKSLLMTITAPYGVVKQGISCDESTQIKLDAYGVWKIEYRATDSNNRATTKTYYITVKEYDAPVVTVNGTPAEKYQAGQTVTFADATVQDASAWELYVMIVKPNGKYSVIQDRSYTFTEVGNFKVLYYAVDEYGNVSIVTYSFAVEGV